MIRVNITAEGFSEELFVKKILAPHLWNKFNIHTEVRKILTSRRLGKRGGMVSYGKFKNDVEQWIKESPQIHHTTLIDLYGLKDDFPGYKSSKRLDAYTKVEKIESSLSDSIKCRNFIPYIQLHEFESLLFSDPIQMEEWLKLHNPLMLKSCFMKIRNEYSTPEEINDSYETAPSKRIIKYCPDYDKVNDGILILEEIGLKTIRKECQHFDEWLTKLEHLK